MNKKQELEEYIDRFHPDNVEWPSGPTGPRQGHFNSGLVDNIPRYVNSVPATAYRELYEVAEAFARSVEHWRWEFSEDLAIDWDERAGMLEAALARFRGEK